MTTKVKSSVLSPTLTGLTSVTSNTFTSDIATGTAPFVVASTTAVLNLTASNVTTNANLTGKITSVGNATSLGSFTSLELLTALSDKTGSGIAVFATGPSFSQPILGTPQSGNFSVGTFTWPTFNQNTTGTAAGLSATLTIASGGTNSTATPTAGGVGYGTGTAHAYTAAGTSGNALISSAAGAPAFGALAIGVANVNVSGALTATNGGTGVATLTGIAYGNGTGAFTAATAAQIVTAISTNAVTNATNATTSTTQAAGTNTTHIATTANVYASSLGWGQTWQNLTSSRVINTTYYNTTGKPITVNLVTQCSATYKFGELLVDGVTLYVGVAITGTAAGAGEAIIPPNASYKLVQTSNSIAAWNELR